MKKVGEHITLDFLGVPSDYTAEFYNKIIYKIAKKAKVEILNVAEHQFKLIFSEISEIWPIESSRLARRIGIVKVNEASLWVEVIASHRKEAFAACQHLITEMKNRVPIWKKPINL